MIDTHAHLNDPKLLPLVDDIVADSYFDAIMVVGYHKESSKKAVELAQDLDKVYAIVGCHPHDATSLSDSECDYYREVSKLKKVVAIGEIGLDYYYDRSPRIDQKSAFIKQIILADELGLPIVLHVRDAYGDTLEILEQYKDRLNNGVLVHCYSGSVECVREFSRYGCYFALGGAVTYKGAKKEDVIRAIPIDKLVLETDAPYLTPTPKRGETNQPKYIAYTLKKVSEVLDISEKQLEEIVTDNAKRFFRL